mmetsp:Transcript_87398/g.219969  ORF Transcript_87398/g.219969 Transcript_87398/m.219969 type:complete len:255 (-) Transcript_87398:21-785(-)
MAPELRLGRLGHGHDPSFRDLPRHERREHGEAEDKGEALVEAPLHVLEGLGHARVLLAGVQRGLRVARVRGLHGELLLVVGPESLATDPDLVQGLDAVAYVGAGILGDGALHRALVVVDEEPRRNEVLDVLPDLVVVEGGTQRVSRAAAQVALVVDREMLRGAQIDVCREVAGLGGGQVEGPVAEVRQVALPTHRPRRPHGDAEARLVDREGLVAREGAAGALRTHPSSLSRPPPARRVRPSSGESLLATGCGR